MSQLKEFLLPAYAGDLASTPAGYFEFTGASAETPPVRTIAQFMMRTTVYATIYQTIRPLGRRILGALRGPGREGDRREIAGLLGLEAGSVVYDIGCGPGNFTGWFGEQVGPEGFAVGLDASVQMLTRAAKDNLGPSVAYLRGNAEKLPFADDSADAVACLAALYLINDPGATLSEMLRVVKPGGRVVILTSLGPPNQALRTAGTKIGGATLFGRDEVTRMLADRGAVDIEQTLQGVAQTVVATKPSAA